MTIGPPPQTDYCVDITDEQVAFFAANGHVTIDRITTDEELEWFRAAYDQFEAMPRSGYPDTVFDVGRPYGTTEEPDLGQLLFPERRIEGVHDTALWRNGRRMAQRLLDVPTNQIESWGHIIFKPPRHGGETPWHQDEAYWDTNLAYHAVGAWVPLDDVDVDNGCLWFQPGSHRGDVLQHRHVGDDPRVHILEVLEPIDTSTVVPVPMAAGAVSFHHPRTLHHAHPNRTDRHRRAWATEYQTAPIELSVPADRPWVDEGRKALIDTYNAGALVNDPTWNPAYIDPTLDARATSFENRSGARGAGGQEHGGRKGAPNRELHAGERVVLADIEGPGVIRHIWMTFLPARPERMRSLYLEVFYDGASEPSISVPCLDFFGLPHGRPVAYHSALTAANEGRGFNSYVPMPFRDGVRVELVNGSPKKAILYYQIDYTLQPSLPDGLGYLHASFRRENPTTQRRDFVITEGLRGPGRFLGCNVGVRVIDAGAWYGEGEVKVYRDGDDEHPTICGTGLEDYVGSAWGMGAHSAPYGGAPLVVGEHGEIDPDFVAFYRWHVPDPVMFERELRVTIQQIGAMFFAKGQEEQLAAYEKTNPVAGTGWNREAGPNMLAWGIVERVDDYCATAYVYCTEPQPVPRLDLAVALADIERRDYESPSRTEQLNSVVDPSRT